MPARKTLTDILLYKVVGIIFTPDEWHAFITGFFDGISLSKEGKLSRKVAEKCGTRTQPFEDEDKSWDVVAQKAHYYNFGYTVGEYSKVIILPVVAGGIAA